MKRTIILSLICVCITLCAQPVSAKKVHTKDLPRQFTVEERLYSLSTVWSEIKYNFVHMDRIAFDVDSLYRAYIPQVMAARNDMEFMDCLRRFMTCFNDGHTEVAYPSYNFSWYSDYAPIGFVELEGRYYCHWVLESSGLDSLALGAELIEIEGVSTREYIEEHYFPTVTIGSEEARLAAMASSGFIGTGLIGSRFRGSLRYTDGQIVPFKMRNDMFQREEKGKGNGREWMIEKDMNIYPMDDVSLHPLGNDIWRLHFRGFNTEDIGRIDSLIAAIRPTARGVVIDLRSCPGGASPVGEHLLHYLVDADSLMVEACQTRIGHGYGRSQGNYRPEYEPFYKDRAFETMPAVALHLDRSKLLPFPVVILTGVRTASAAETFLVELSGASNRPAIIGQKTAGSTGAPLVIDLPHNAFVRICTLRHLYPDGTPFDNKGFVPDEEIPLTYEDYFTGYDRTMARALEIIRAMRE